MSPSAGLYPIIAQGKILTSIMDRIRVAQRIASHITDRAIKAQDVKM
jgi:hypothetical protein